MIFTGFFWRQIFFGSTGPWHLFNVTFIDLSFALNFKLIEALHGGLPKLETKLATLAILPVKWYLKMNISATTGNFRNLFEIWLHYTCTHGMSQYECQSHSRVFCFKFVHKKVHKKLVFGTGTLSVLRLT